MLTDECTISVVVPVDMVDECSGTNRFVVLMDECGSTNR